MSYSTTWSALQADLKNWLENDETDFSSTLPRIIALGEERAVRDLDLDIFKETDTGTTTASDDTISAPTGMLEASTLYIETGGERYFLKRRNYDWMRWYTSGDTSLTEQPEYFTELNDDDEILLAPTPDASYSYTLRYVERPEGLSASNTSTWLSDHAGDVLFYACLKESETYQVDDSRAQEVNTGYERALMRARQEFRHLRRREYDTMGRISAEG